MEYIYNNLGVLLVILFAGSSYLVGFYAVVKGKYKPNAFTRVVFLFLSVNNLISVINLDNQVSAKSLAWVIFLGSLLTFFSSVFVKGQKYWSLVETFSSILLFISLLIWIFVDIPMVNLLFGLFAHLIGSIPTFSRVLKDPTSENIPFWGLFALGSFIALFSIKGGEISDYIFVIYFCIFDTVLVLLAARRFLKRKLLKS
jgi:hypothetical protein